MPRDDDRPQPRARPKRKPLPVRAARAPAACAPSLAGHEAGADGLGPITPLSIPGHVRTVVVVGGSFDPPHVYHIIGPLAAVQRLFPESGWLLYVPAAKSPLKSPGPSASDRHRLAMLRLALDGPGPRSIWTDELDRAGKQRGRRRASPSFTIDTLRRLRSILPRRVRLRLLIGADQAAQFHRWKDFRQIMRIAEPVVLPREGVETASRLRHALTQTEAWTKTEVAQWCRRMAPTVPMVAASSSIRERIPRAPARPERWADVQGLSDVTTAVATYIVKQRLYGFGTRRRAARVARPSPHRLL